MGSGTEDEQAGVPVLSQPDGAGRAGGGPCCYLEMARRCWAVRPVSGQLKGSSVVLAIGTAL